MLEKIGVLSDLAEGQTGQVTLVQAERARVSRAVVDELISHRAAEWVLPEVLRLRGGARHPFPRLYARWLLLDPGTPAWERISPHSGVASHSAAIRAYGVGAMPGPEAEFTVPPTAATPAVPGAEIHATVVDDYRDIFGLPVTTPVRTFADIVSAGRLDVEDLGRIAASFLSRKLATDSELAAVLSAHLESQAAAGNGEALLASMLEAAAGDTSAPAGRG